MIYNYNIDISDRCSMILSRSRTKAGLSRRRISEIIGVSESTVKAWESGQGSPTLSGIFCWFHATGDNPYSSMLEFFWPHAFGHFSYDSSDAEIMHSLTVYLQEVAGSSELRKLNYLIFGDHGGQWSGLLDMACAHAHTSLNSRYRVSEIIQTSYELSVANGTARLLPDIQAEENLLIESIRAAKSASSAHREGYTMNSGKDEIRRISAQILMKSRMDAGATQRDLAKAMGKTERTIRAWETSIEPSFLDMCVWFHSLNKSIWPYLRNALNLEKTIELDEQDKRLCQDLIDYFSFASSEEVRKICFLIFGQKGSYWKTLLELLFEHVCTPLFQRVISARSVLIGYQLDRENAMLRGIDLIMPDDENLLRCIRLGTYAARKGRNSYRYMMTLPEDEADIL